MIRLIIEQLTFFRFFAKHLLTFKGYFFNCQAIILPLTCKGFSFSGTFEKRLINDTFRCFRVSKCQRAAFQGKAKILFRIIQPDDRLFTGIDLKIKKRKSTTGIGMFITTNKEYFPVNTL